MEGNAGKARFQSPLVPWVTGWVLVLTLNIAAAEYPVLPESSAQWLADRGEVALRQVTDIPIERVRQAETRVFDFIERGTGRLVRMPERPEDQLAVARHLHRLNEVLAEPVFIQSGQGQVGFIHGSRFGSGTVPVDLGDGQVVYRCVSMRDHLLGKTSLSTFPGFIRWTEE